MRIKEEKKQKKREAKRASNERDKLKKEDANVYVETRVEEEDEFD